MFKSRTLASLAVLLSLSAQAMYQGGRPRLRVFIPRTPQNTAQTHQQTNSNVEGSKTATHGTTRIDSVTVGSGKVSQASFVSVGKGAALIGIANTGSAGGHVTEPSNAHQMPHGNTSSTGHSQRSTVVRIDVTGSHAQVKLVQGEQSGVIPQTGGAGQNNYHRAPQNPTQMHQVTGSGVGDVKAGSATKSATHTTPHTGGQSTAPAKGLQPVSAPVGKGTSPTGTSNTGSAVDHVTKPSNACKTSHGNASLANCSQPSTTAKTDATKPCVQAGHVQDGRSCIQNIIDKQMPSVRADEAKALITGNSSSSNNRSFGEGLVDAALPGLRAEQKREQAHVCVPQAGDAFDPYLGYSSGDLIAPPDLGHSSKKAEKDAETPVRKQPVTINTNWEGAEPVEPAQEISQEALQRFNECKEAAQKKLQEIVDAAQVHEQHAVPVASQAAEKTAPTSSTPACEPTPAVQHEKIVENAPDKAQVDEVKALPVLHDEPKSATVDAIVNASSSRIDASVTGGEGASCVVHLGQKNTESKAELTAGSACEVPVTTTSDPQQVNTSVNTAVATPQVKQSVPYVHPFLCHMAKLLVDQKDTTRTTAPLYFVGPNKTNTYVIRQMGMRGIAYSPTMKLITANNTQKVEVDPCIQQHKQEPVCKQVVDTRHTKESTVSAVTPHVDTPVQDIHHKTTEELVRSLVEKPGNYDLESFYKTATRSENSVSVVSTINSPIDAFPHSPKYLSCTQSTFLRQNWERAEQAIDAIERGGLGLLQNLNYVQLRNDQFVVYKLCAELHQAAPHDAEVQKVVRTLVHAYEQQERIANEYERAFPDQLSRRITVADLAGEQEYAQRLQARHDRHSFWGQAKSWLWQTVGSYASVGAGVRFDGGDSLCQPYAQVGGHEYVHENADGGQANADIARIKKELNDSTHASSSCCVTPQVAPEQSVVCTESDQHKRLQQVAPMVAARVATNSPLKTVGTGALLGIDKYDMPAGSQFLDSSLTAAQCTPEPATNSQGFIDNCERVAGFAAGFPQGIADACDPAWHAQNIKDAVASTIIQAGIGEYREDYEYAAAADAIFGTSIAPIVEKRLHDAQQPVIDGVKQQAEAFKQLSPYEQCKTIGSCVASTVATAALTHAVGTAIGEVVTTLKESPVAVATTPEGFCVPVCTIDEPHATTVTHATTEFCAAEKTAEHTGQLCSHQKAITWKTADGFEVNLKMDAKVADAFERYGAKGLGETGRAASKIDASTVQGRELIGPKVRTFEQARNIALEITGDLGPESQPYAGRLSRSVGFGKIVGRASSDNKLLWRLDWDGVKGVHIHVEDYRFGKGIHAKNYVIPFEGNEETFKLLLKQLNR